MRSLLASFSLLTLLVVGCEPATEAPKETPKVEGAAKPDPAPKTDAPKAEMAPTPEAPKEAPKADAPKEAPKEAPKS